MKTTPLPWWRTDQYDIDGAIPAELHDNAGPHGPALIQAYGDGRTQAGWGDETFMAKYLADDFAPNKALWAYRKKTQPFAFVMRSLRMVAIDIDGKNGGLEHAKKLGALPLTLAETSKSGDGYHLFYLLDQEWDEKLGFGSVHDRIGIEQGVDIRATGCVFHYHAQRWNSRSPVLLPKYLLDLLQTKQQERQHRAAHVAKVLNSEDALEILMLQDQLVSDLAKPIPAGKRNNTLFAIGGQMKQAQVPAWEELIEKRANDLGLDQDEIDKLVTNIGKFN